MEETGVQLNPAHSSVPAKAKKARICAKRGKIKRLCNALARRLSWEFPNICPRGKRAHADHKQEQHHHGENRSPIIFRWRRIPTPSIQTIAGAINRSTHVAAPKKYKEGSKTNRRPAHQQLVQQRGRSARAGGAHERN
jgi:hypothetical protein